MQVEDLERELCEYRKKRPSRLHSSSKLIQKLERNDAEFEATKARIRELEQKGDGDEQIASTNAVIYHKTIGAAYFRAVEMF